MIRMAEKSTFIKIDRNILKWRWYEDANTFRVFVHLIIKANIRDADFERITVKRGQLVTSYAHLARDLGISVRNARTAIEHLKLTGEVTIRSYAKYSVITVLNYDYYQENRQAKRQASDKQPTSSRQQSKNAKERKKNNITAAPVYDEYLEDWE